MIWLSYKAGIVQNIQPVWEGVDFSGFFFGQFWNALPQLRADDNGRHFLEHMACASTVLQSVVGVRGPRFNCGCSPDLDLHRQLEKQVSILFSRYGASWHKHSWLIHHRLVTLTRPSQQFSDLPTPHSSNIRLKSSGLLCDLHAANWVYEFVGQLWALIYDC